MKKTGAQIITTLLEMHGIKIVSGIPGGSILPLYDELVRSNIKHVLVRQEQAGGFIAQGMARTTGVPAVCLATSGPGAMNLLTAIADARCDSIPIIAITGQVNSYLLGTDAFQEADTFGLSLSITKHSVMVKNAEELLKVIPEAFKIAMNGRHGPVLIDVPRDVQLQEVEFDEWPEISLPLKDDDSFARFLTERKEYDVLIKKASELILNAEKPVLYLGGGCNSPKAAEYLREFVKVFDVPVVSSLMGLGAIPSSSKNFIGMVGMHGSYAANVSMYESDLVLALGVRFDDRATGVIDKFCPCANIIHIDIDAAEINKILFADVAIVAKVEAVLPDLTRILKENTVLQKNAETRKTWFEKIARISEETDSVLCGTPADGEKRVDFKGSVNPRAFIANVPVLAKKTGLNPKDLIVTTDVGQHQMWAAQYYPVEDVRTFLTSGSLGTMGFGLPAAIGAAFANPEKRIVCFSGDGSILMNIQELATLAENNVAVTVIVFENGTLGMVYQQQKIAEGFGIEVADADIDKDWYKKAFDSNRKNKPFFVRVRVDPEENVLPFVIGGKTNIDSIR